MHVTVVRFIIFFNNEADNGYVFCLANTMRTIDHLTLQTWVPAQFHDKHLSGLVQDHLYAKTQQHVQWRTSHRSILLLLETPYHLLSISSSHPAIQLGK
ncbi:hypothetical protein PsorP6_009992 [Peronosclerospora sorghi]|uniref:Uncharacterized protein n=1 Tax=Peronosclerospora sorghi TaxID=230839 RepID=A0ACC0VVD5_9STRA|nr:hypothetical protein PsorP6_009992 [Peronosclerospora sorghi]